MANYEFIFEWVRKILGYKIFFLFRQFIIY